MYLKPLLHLLLILLLLCGSFMLTEKTVSVVREYDDIMIMLKEQEKKYYRKPQEAKIVEDTIIPGLKGQQIDIDKSYSNMRRYGTFEESLIEFIDIFPKIRWKNYHDKYIIQGNSEKNMISLLFLVEHPQEDSKILDILKTKKIKATFFIDDQGIEKNMNFVQRLVEEGHEIGNAGYREKYDMYSFLKVDNLLKRRIKQPYYYCYSDKKDEKILEVCKNYKYYTILPTQSLDKDFYRIIKKQIRAGSIFLLKDSKELEEQLPTILNYILSKGYQIEPLQIHLEE